MKKKKEPLFTMKRSIRSRWIRALRSGKYKQGEGNLLKMNADGTGNYCCLGVLCELAAKDGVVAWRNTPGEPVLNINGETGMLPMSVQQWADIKDNRGWLTSNPTVSQDDDNYEVVASEANDEEGLTLREIADLIQKNSVGV